MPTPPGGDEPFSQLNFVIDSWARPCEAPWYVYIETLKPAALEAFIVLISFGWADVLRGRFRPKGLGRRSGKRKGRWGRRLPRFPEIGDTIGKALPFGEQVEDFVKWNCNTRFLWRIDNALQAGFFWWLVADVVDEFAFEWTSLLYKTRWCEASNLGRFSYHEAGGAPIQDNAWKVFGFPSEDYEFPPPSWGVINGWSGPNGCTVSAGAGIKQRLPFPPPTSFRLVIWNDDAGEPIRDYDACVLATPGTGTACTNVAVPPNTNFQVRGWMEGTPFATITEGNVTATEAD